jgi:choline dehydrogenase
MMNPAHAYDVVVVGAGSARAVIAARLSESSSRRVLLVEAGPDYPTLESLPDKLKRGYITGGRHHLWENPCENMAEVLVETV